MANTTTMSGLNILYKDSPLDFNAVSSLFSDKLPNVIMDDRRIARGSANGIKLAET